MIKIKAWISAARLRTLPLSISGIVVAAAVAKDAGMFSLSVFIFALLTTLGFQILSNFANDYGDGVKGTDNADRVGPKRALQSGLLTEKELKRGMIVTTAITLLLASMLIFAAFGNESLLLSFIFFNLGIAAVVAAIKYTVGKSAYGYRALGDVFVFIFFGLVGVVGCYFLFTQTFSHYVFLPAISIGLMSTAVLNLNNMRDRLSDAKVNKNTLAVVLGGSKVKMYHAFLIITSFLTALWYVYLTAEKGLEYLPLIAFIPLFINLVVVYKNQSPPLLDPELKKVALSTFLFSILLFGMQLL
ncbi:1,4-dihydroxy-2-naphthoate octaprenyltransferase [Patiriisocius sp. Uisw_017]|jgi:1,4-dihydroxy-2-naphthoate octaprenyltransferase|uniref:1,4-dihydroxy-2-naphthoate octaprenyltransferase n=1 Tax=Patiriisocius sp. Uisw_017 TaxID=3230968 RepID=UPI0039EC4867